MTALYWVLAALLALLAVGIWRGWGAGVIRAITPPADLQGELLQQAALARLAARLLAALVITLTAIWAYQAHPNPWVAVVFTAGFIGYVIAREAAIPAAVNAWHAGRHGALLAWGGSAGIATLMLFLSGVFELANQTGAETAARIESSKPAAALDSEIATTRDRLAGLAPYADPAKADAETAQVAAQAQAQAARVAALQADVDAARAAAAPYANPDCTPKKDGRGNPYTSRAAAACAEIQAAQAALERAQTAPTGGALYTHRHAEYNGLQAHLLALEKQRAALSESGGGIQSAHRPEDKLTAAALHALGWIDSADPEKSAWIKWAFLSFIFDLSAVFLLVSAQGNVRAAGGDPVGRFRALLSAGVDPTTAAGLLAQDSPEKPPTTATTPTIPPAGVILPDAIPALSTGGLITSDGLAILHAGERVLTVEETQEYHRWKAAHGAQGGLNKAGLNTGGPNKAGLTGGPTVQHHWHGLERVPPELSRRAGAGRVGKLDTCRDCGEDYQVKMHNATRCPPCTEKAQATYKRWRK